MSSNKISCQYVTHTQLYTKIKYTFTYSHVNTIYSTYQKEDLRFDSMNIRLTGINFLNTKISILIKVEVSFTVHFFPCKYRFDLDTFSKQFP